jgi:Flp pilus assembly protein TadD
VVQLQAGDDKGLATMQSALQIKPWDADARWRAGHAVVVSGTKDPVRLGQAVVWLQGAFERLPGAVECGLDVGQARANVGYAAGALEVLQAALTNDPVNVTTLLQIGGVQSHAGDYSAAEATFRRAAELRPSAAEPWQELATLYHVLGRTVDEQSAARKAAELEHG